MGNSLGRHRPVPPSAASGSPTQLPSSPTGQLVVGRSNNAYRDAYKTLGKMAPDQLPIVYSPKYNIGFFGLERLHPFDAQKFGKVVASLVDKGVIQQRQCVDVPREATLEELLQVHSERYLQKLHGSSAEAARVLEFPPVALFPSWLVDRVLLRPMRYHVNGTVLAAALALEFGWSINIGGGMHHAYWDGGGGWCAYADITLALQRLRSASSASTAAAAAGGTAAGGSGQGLGTAAALPPSPGAPALPSSSSAAAAAAGAGVGAAVRRVMVIDLDVHQGNGIERDVLHFEGGGAGGGGQEEDEGGGGRIETYIVDAYNAQIYPLDAEAKRAIRTSYEFGSGVDDGAYLQGVATALRTAFREFPHPDLVMFNAGTDVLEGDPLGSCRVSAQGVARRDEMVFEAAREAGSPVCMLLSGGYARRNAAVVADSIANLLTRFELVRRPTAAGVGRGDDEPGGTEPAGGGGKKRQPLQGSQQQRAGAG